MMLTNSKAGHSQQISDTFLASYSRLPQALVIQADLGRAQAFRSKDDSKRSEMGQYMTPSAIGKLMASMFDMNGDSICLLDPGAGVGALSAAWVSELLTRRHKPTRVSLLAYEVDNDLLPYLRRTLNLCRDALLSAGIEATIDLRGRDFVAEAVRVLAGEFNGPTIPPITSVIMNPPYRKINTGTKTRQLLDDIGLPTSNLYSAFVGLSCRLLEKGGELVAITPRSFCNGPYFRLFRQEFLDLMSLRQIHIFESRKEAFKQDDVLQENIIISAQKGPAANGTVIINMTQNAEDEVPSVRTAHINELVKPEDPDKFIHIIPDEISNLISKRMTRFKGSLKDLNVEVSTGRVVDFRAKGLLLDRPSPGSIPLIYPCNIVNGFIQWPKRDAKKPQALRNISPAEQLVVPKGNYVLVKRFSAKEETKRVCAGVINCLKISGNSIAIENHLNYFHSQGVGMDEELAKGLAVYLNSNLVDAYFRQFSGHTQVNAMDLRSMKYPTAEQLRKIGKGVGQTFPDQSEIDRIVEEDLLEMSKDQRSKNPIRIKKRIEEALGILKTLGLPREQQNERSALTLLALLGLKPEMAWQKAQNPYCGITPMMEFFSEHYGKTYAPNTRETVRRQTVHQFLDAGLIVANPDDPNRATNSAKNVYQVEEGTLELLRTFGSSEWEKSLKTYLASRGTLQQRYANERKMNLIPVRLPDGQTLILSPGGQNVLIKEILNQFCPRFSPGGSVLYVGDTGDKWSLYDAAAIQNLGLSIESHGKMPDVVIHFKEKNWLLLVEAVTSHGPINPKRHGELKRLFGEAKIPLVFITAFLSRHTMLQYLSDISWETEVWVAESPSHMIHFNGERFLGPYPGAQG